MESARLLTGASASSGQQFSGGDFGRGIADSRSLSFSSAERAEICRMAAYAMLARGGGPEVWNGPEVPALEFPCVPFGPLQHGRDL